MYTIYGNVLNGRVDIQTLANKYYNLSSHVGQLSFHHSSSGLENYHSEQFKEAALNWLER